MTANPLAPLAATDGMADDDVVDLRYYFGVLLRWWKEILLVALLAALLAAGGFWLLNLGDDDLYQAAADVAIVRTITDVNFDERFTTTSETIGAPNAATRRNALLALAVSPALAVEVIAELGDALPAELRQPSRLAARVDAGMGTGNGRGDSDLIRIAATAPEPELAARIATAWAQAYVRSVNQVYGQVPNEMLANIEQEQLEAEAGLVAVQQELEAFTARSRINALGREIADITETIGTLRDGRQAALDSLVRRAVAGRDLIAQAISNAQATNLSAPYVAEQRGKRAIVEAYIVALYDAQAQVLSEQASRDSQLLADYYTRWLQVTNALDGAQALRGQVAAAGEDATGDVLGSSALVLSLLKLQAFTQATDPDPQQMELASSPSSNVTAQASDETPAATAPGLLQATQPVQVQVDATPLQIQLSDGGTVSRAALLADIDALVVALTERQATLEGQIADLSAQMESGASIAPSAALPTDSLLAQTIQEQTPRILESQVLSGSVAAGLASPAWGTDGELLALLQTDDLQALAAAADADSALDATIAALEEELRGLNAALEAERAEEGRLVQRRNLAQASYTAIGNKIAELTLSRVVGNSEVRLAAPGVAPRDPLVGISPLLVGAAAGVVGLLFGVIVAFVADFLGRAPFLSRRSAMPAASRPA